MKISASLPAVCALAICGWSIPAAEAASIVSLNTLRINSVSTANLTQLGDLDWAYWAPNTGTLVPTAAPTNEKASGSLIGSLSPVGGGSLRGSPTATTVESYTFTDGTTPTTGNAVSAAGLVFNSNLGSSSPGKGLTLSLAGSTTADTYVTLFLGGYGAASVLTLTLNNATTVINSSQVFSATSPKEIAAYSFSFRPDSVSDLLNISYTVSTVTGSVSDTNNAHVGFQAAAVSAFPQMVVPEPGSAALAMFGLLTLGLRRRR